ncbi:MAG: AMP-binding protein, partial [Gemmatimonadota bacterium]|nr:AMP-binding protein [Gemmatimonadota bacterium]
VHGRMPDVRFFACGGASLDAGIHRDLASLGFRVLEAYGLTETAPLVSANSLKRPVFGSVGRAADQEIRIERTDPALDEGEVLVRGDNVMLGYFRNLEATREAIAGGWFRTGDLGRLDDRGSLFLSGRLKEVIVMPSGKNIYPEELEKIYSGTSLAEEVCICTTADEKGEHLTAVVVPSREVLQQRRTANIYEDIKFSVENLTVGLPSYQRVTRVVLSEEPFPRTRLGKLKRYEIQKSLERKAASAYSPKRAPETGEEPRDEICAFVKQVLRLEYNPTGRENLELDLGLDSLAKIEFLSFFEKHFGVTLTDSQAGAVLTVDDLKTLAAEIESAASGTGPRERAKEKTPLEQVVELKESWTGRAFRTAGYLLLRFLLRPLYRIRITGLEHIPDSGAFVLAPNHVSYLDWPLLFASLPRRVAGRLFSVGIADIFDHFPFSLLCYRGRLIKTGTLATTAMALSYCEEILKKGCPLCLFPEGKRSIDGKVDNPRPGAGRLALRCGVPLVPVHIRGTKRVFSRMNRGLRLTNVEIEFPGVIEPKGTEKDITAAWLKVMTERDHLV